MLDIIRSLMHEYASVLCEKSFQEKKLSRGVQKRHGMKTYIIELNVKHNV